VTHLPLLTTSRARSFRACARLHHYAYNLGFRTLRAAEALRFGTLMHLALEAWWRAWMTGIDALLAAMAALESESDPFDRARAEALMIGYHARWIEWHPEALEVLAVERQFCAPLINPLTRCESRTWSFAGKLDAIARRKDRVLVVEHKTTSEDVTAGSEYWRRLRMDPQITNYLAAASSLGFDARACLYDVIRKPDARPYKATPESERKYTKPTKKDPVSRLYANQRERDETPEEFRARLLTLIEADPDRFYARGEIVRLEGEVDEGAYDLWSTGRAIRDAQLADRHPRNPDHCMHWGRACDFFGVCTGVATLDDPTKFRQLDNVNEELKEEQCKLQP
jgi:hypothetical protein